MGQTSKFDVLTDEAERTIADNDNDNDKLVYVKNVLKGKLLDVLLGPAQLYEALRAKSAGSGLTPPT